MHHLINKTNSPYTIHLADGSSVMLPARGELKGVEVHPLHIHSVRVCGYIQLTESSAEDAPEEPKKTRKK